MVVKNKRVFNWRLLFVAAQSSFLKEPIPSQQLEENFHGKGKKKRVTSSYFTFLQRKIVGKIKTYLHFLGFPLFKQSKDKGVHLHLVLWDHDWYRRKWECLPFMDLKVTIFQLPLLDFGLRICERREWKRCERKWILLHFILELNFYLKPFSLQSYRKWNLFIRKWFIYYFISF